MTEMTARAKAALAIALTMALTTAAGATETETQPVKQSVAPIDACMALARYDVVKTAQAFTTFSMPIFGKHPERWTVADVNNLFANVQACDGKPTNVVPQARVTYGSWRRIFNRDMLSKTLGISNASIEIARALQPFWPAESKMPYCADLLNWKRDPVWLVNNAAEIFGTPFYSLSDEGAGAIKNFVNACQPVVAAIVKARGSRIGTASKTLLSDIVTSVERDQGAQRWAQIDFVPAFKVSYEGQPIPFSYIGKNTQEIALRLNTSERNKIPLSQDELATISRWTTDMLRSKKEGPDVEYVKAIKGVVAAQLFSQSTAQ
jgi:hypothetical protein